MEKQISKYDEAINMMSEVEQTPEFSAVGKIIDSVTATVNSAVIPEMQEDLKQDLKDA